MLIAARGDRSRCRRDVHCHAGSRLRARPFVLLAPGVPYAVLTVLAVLRMRRDGTLSEKLLPAVGRFHLRRPGDGDALSRAPSRCGCSLAPQGSARERWIMRIYLQIGDPELLQRRVVCVSLGVVGGRGARRDLLARARVLAARRAPWNASRVAGDRRALRAGPPADGVPPARSFAGRTRWLSSRRWAAASVWGLIVARDRAPSGGDLFARALHVVRGDLPVSALWRPRAGLQDRQAIPLAAAIACDAISSSEMSKSA